jgi:uncharacterized membrane protein
VLLDSLPWPILLATGGFVVIAAAYRLRPAVFARFGFGREEVALLTLGSVAGWAVNLPVASLGSSILALNVGGALVALFMAGLWIHKRLLPPLRVAGGVALVAAVAHAIVTFDPGVGILAPYPWFFLPPAAAFAYALLVCARDTPRMVPIAFTSGSIGALVGADLLNLPQIVSHFSDSQSQASVVSVGGAGVFDMVFLAGVVPMAMTVLLLAFLTPGTLRDKSYPGRMWQVADPEELWRRFSLLDDANDLERAVASLGLAGQALEDDDFPRSVRMSYLAVDALLKAGTPPVALRISEWPAALREDILLLSGAYANAKEGRASREDAGRAEHTAKAILGTLAAETRLPCRLEDA